MKIRPKAKCCGNESPCPITSGLSTQAVEETVQAANTHSLKSPAKKATGQSVVSDAYLTKPTLHNTMSETFVAMEGPKLETQNGKQSTSPTHGRVSVLVQDKHDPGQARNESPAELTELVSTEAQKTFHPASDKNHNFASPYVVSPPEMLHYSYPVPETNSDNKNCDHSDINDHTSAKTGLLSGVYYPAMYGSELSNMYEHSLYSGPFGSYVYPKDAQYQQSYTFSEGVCKNYCFPTPESGREHSSPELAYSGSSTHTPLNNSNSSMAESPESSHLSPDGRSLNAGKDSFMISAKIGNANKGLSPDMGQDVRPGLSWNNSSVHNSYYSDEQSLEGDSIRDIEQDILQSDIEKHIYENYSQNLKIYTPDDQSFDDPEDLSPVQDLSQRKSSTGSKKRRRRTQTPVQRRAANMRERKRMCHLNLAFNGLKDRLPNVRNRKKLSRIQTLRAAIFYISLLSECIQSS